MMPIRPSHSDWTGARAASLACANAAGAGATSAMTRAAGTMLRIQIGSNISRPVIYRRDGTKSTLGCVAHDTERYINGTGRNFALLYRHTRRYLNAKGEPNRRSVGRLRKS